MIETVPPWPSALPPASSAAVQPARLAGPSRETVASAVSQLTEARRVSAVPAVALTLTMKESATRVSES
jgi:hypothetical protein